MTGIANLHEAWHASTLIPFGGAMSETDVKRSSGFAATSTLVLVMDVGGLLVLGAVCVAAIPAFCKMFAELNTALPVITQAVISIPRAGYAAIHMLLLAGLVAKESLIRDRSVTLTINVIAGLIGVLWVIVVIYALFMPLVFMPISSG